MGLRDWVSEKAPGLARDDARQRAASMGLRDWVSEKVKMLALDQVATVELQWGSETGSRRRHTCLCGQQ